VINGESWGVYVSVQQFNKDFVKEWFETTKGARWKVPGSPGGRGSLAYLGDDPARITATLRRTFATQDIVFSFGGIGATPDDHTRQCAATALGRPLARHPDAVKEIEARFGEAAYPKRVLMAEFPQGADLVPNPVNRIAGFSVESVKVAGG
jgi:molybdopterin-biosynthesis enzyme MoeA-like protein